MSNDVDGESDAPAGGIPEVPEADAEQELDFKLDEDLLYRFDVGQGTVIVEDQSDESEGGHPLSKQRPELEAYTLETKDLDAQFAAQIEDAESRYQRSLGDVTAGAGLDAMPDPGKVTEALDKAAEAMTHAVNQLLEHWNANRR